MKSNEIIAKIRLKLKDSNPEHRTVLSIFQFNFTDSNGQVIKNIVFDFQKLDIYEGRTAFKDGEITIRDEDFYALSTKQCDFVDLVATQKVLLEGDTCAIQKMMNKFNINRG